MDEYKDTLRAAIDAAAGGDLQALYVARWLLTELEWRFTSTSVSESH